MKRLLLFFISISLLSFIDSNTNTKKTTYFEGQITYSIDYTPYNASISPEKIKELVGSKMVLTFKKGNYKKQYFAPSGKLVQERILNLRVEKSYFRTFDSDTIFWIDILKNDSPTTFEILESSTYLDHPCNIIKTKSKVSVNGLDNEIVEIESLFKYAKDLPVDPIWYANYFEGNFNDIIKHAKGIAIESINKGMFWEQKITLHSITKRKVKRKELKLDYNKETPFKKL